MKYLSLCSGVEAATVAWEALGWQAIAFAEYDAFPSAALAHHYPDVLNLGDLTLVTEQQIKDLQPIDLVVAGTPCQDLSVAGKGAGLDGERSGLYRTALTIFSWCRKHHGTRFFLGENVPGAYSSNKGRDFAEVVKSMAGLDDLDVPKYGWGKEGAAVGDNGMLEWACLDAQFFGLAQRRKRVFALLDTGNWASRPPVLLERESLRGDSPPSRETQQEVTTHVGVGVKVPSSLGHWDSLSNPHPTLNQSNNAGGIAMSDQELFSQRGAGLVYEPIGAVDGENNGLTMDKPCGPLMAGSPSGGGRPLPAVCYAIKGTAIDRKPENGGNGLGVEEGVSPTLTSADRHAVAPLSGYRMEAFGQYADDNTASTMKARDYKDATDLSREQYKIRRLTPIECERLQGFPDNYTNVPYNGKPNSPNGQRYKALGNSMAVPVMRYIGQQIDAALLRTHNQPDSTNPIQPTQQEQHMQAPKTLEELREAIQTPFRMYELAAAHKWSNEDKKNIGEWIRQLVTKGHAIRFNQEWPTPQQNAKKETILMKPQIGQTVIATAALKAAMDADLAIVFGHRPYKLLRRDSPLRKGGYLYCTHKRAEPDEHAKQVWTALARVVQLSMVTQHHDAQQFFYNEETSQYLIRTTLTKRQVEVWDSLDAAVEQEAEAPAAPDPVAQGVRTACIQCEEVSFMTDADKIAVGESIRFMCEGCRAARP